MLVRLLFPSNCKLSPLLRVYEANERRDRSEKRVGDDVRYKVELSKKFKHFVDSLGENIMQAA